MRLLVSCIPYDGGKSGISVYVREVVHALHEQGHSLTLLVEPDGSAKCKIENVKCKMGEEDRSILHSPFYTLHSPRWTRRAVLDPAASVRVRWIRHLRGEPARVRVVSAADRGHHP